MISIVTSSGLDPVSLHVLPDNISSVQVLKGARQQVGDVLRKEKKDVSAWGLRSDWKTCVQMAGISK